MAVPKSVLWEREPHTAAKHALLNRYLQAWFPIMAKHFGSAGITFADAFAGPGEYTNSRESSPTIAMSNALRAEVSQFRTPNRLLFLEAEADRAKHLHDGLIEWFPTEHRPPSLDVNVVHGRCEVDLLTELSRIGAWQGPIFVNLDGWGVDTPYDVVRRIGAQPSSEVLVTFQDQWFTRFATLQEQPAGDRVFGDSEWREVTTLPTESKKAFLVTAYRKRLNAAGFKLTLTFEMVDEGGHALFLVFGTTNDKGFEKMKDALWAVDPVAGGRFRDPRDPQQLSFDMTTPDFSPLRHEFVRLMTLHGTIDLAALARHALLETIYKPSHAKVAIDELLANGIVRQVSTGRSSEQKVYGLANGGRTAERQSTLF